MGKSKPMQDIAYTPEQARKLGKTAALGQMYGAGPNTLKGLEFDEVILDDLAAIMKIYGIDLLTQIKINNLENTKIKRLLYDKPNKTNI